MLRDRRIFLAPPKDWKGYDTSWSWPFPFCLIGGLYDIDLCGCWKKLKKLWRTMLTVMGMPLLLAGTFLIVDCMTLTYVAAFEKCNELRRTLLTVMPSPCILAGTCMLQEMLAIWCQLAPVSDSCLNSWHPSICNCVPPYYYIVYSYFL